MNFCIDRAENRDVSPKLQPKPAPSGTSGCPPYRPHNLLSKPLTVNDLGASSLPEHRLLFQIPIEKPRASRATLKMTQHVQRRSSVKLAVKIKLNDLSYFAAAHIYGCNRGR